MSDEAAPTPFREPEWVRYNDRLVAAVVWVVLGLVVATVGLVWGVQGLETAIVEHERGMMLVRGGASNGALKGPLLSSLGMVLVVHGTGYYHRARTVRRQVSRR